MKNTIFIIWALIFFIISGDGVRASGVFPLKVEQLAPGVTQISNVANVGYVTLGAGHTPDGKYLIITASGEFCVLPTANLDAAIGDLDKARGFEGIPSGYLPSGKIVFSTVRGLYALDPATEKISTVFALPAGEIDEENAYLAWRLVVLSDELIVSGDGDSGDGTPDGNILRFDVRRGRRTRGASVPGFFNPRLSPSRKFILFEHGNGLDKNNANLYDVARGTSYPVESRFDFKRAFPKYKRIKVRPVAWSEGNRLLAEVEKIGSRREISDATYISKDTWLVLLDAATGKIIWKSQTEMPFGATSYRAVNETRMLVDTGEWKPYELSLADGKVKRLENLEGAAFALSPDRRTAAYFPNTLQVFTAALDGSEKKKILNLPRAWQLDRWTLQPPLWSPDGRRLIVFSEKEFLYVHL